MASKYGETYFFDGKKTRKVHGTREVGGNDIVVTVTYGKTRQWETRKEAMDFFWDAILNSEGAERDRYITVYAQLKDGMAFCSDY